MSCFQNAKVQNIALYSKQRYDENREKHYPGEYTPDGNIHCDRASIAVHRHAAAEQRCLISLQRFSGRLLDEEARQAIASICDRNTDHRSDKQISRIMNSEIQP